MPFTSEEIEKYLEPEGFTVVCESPFEIEHAEGSTADGYCAHTLAEAVITQAKSKQRKEAIMGRGRVMLSREEMETWLEEHGYEVTNEDDNPWFESKGVDILFWPEMFEFCGKPVYKDEHFKDRYRVDGCRWYLLPEWTKED